jgi:predicted HD superfamily hydrolase involved in NAD metabolism
MNKVFSDLVNNFDFFGEVDKDAANLFARYNCNDIAEHSNKVANEAKKIAKQFGKDEKSAYIAACLHDISGVFPNSERLNICEELGIDILPEERIVPALLHSKLSKVMAEEIFGIRDESILSAIECHSTLKSNASVIDMIVFIADKIQNFTDNSAFIKDINEGLEKSLEMGTFAYLKYLYDNRESLKVYHPWALEAYNDMRNRCE